MLIVCVLVFSFKQKTAYERRISDWSSDVCSSDLVELAAAAEAFLGRLDRKESDALGALLRVGPRGGDHEVAGVAVGDERLRAVDEIGRASCGERARQYV